ncbi:MAG: glutathionylspermidine synthase family protein [Armatimonadetes bacterium]|nr:glutathionylspermidine synthase family protein [Armatimonadota bacterium]
MERITSEPRPDWKSIVEEQGLTFHMTGDVPYWDESAFYAFTAQEIAALETATYALNEMCLQAVEHVVTQKLYDRFLIPEAFAPWVAESWERDERTVYGRFDLAFDGSTIKMLEYNADTPTCLIEAAVAQWHWFKATAGENDTLDQFNSLHERLIEAWATVKSETVGDETLYFTSVFDGDTGGEDFMSANYLRDTAAQAGLTTEWIAVGQIGFHPRRGFTDLRERPIRHLFKLYPWEWLIRERFSRHLRASRTRFLEAPWKMVLSNKAILPLLYELFPESPYLLRADFAPLPGDYVQKPILGREGANTRIVRGGETVAERGGDYDTGAFVYQEYVPLKNFGRGFPVVGSWMVNGYAAGIGIREDDHPITGNECRFVPHLFEAER